MRANSWEGSSIVSSYETRIFPEWVELQLWSCRIHLLGLLSTLESFLALESPRKTLMLEVTSTYTNRNHRCKRVPKKMLIWGCIIDSCQSPGSFFVSKIFGLELKLELILLTADILHQLKSTLSLIYPFLSHMGVSKNRGTPKWMVYNGKPF